jgi:site-specific DNA-methyltransferase (adenine-specific)
VNLLYYGDNLDVLRRHIQDNSVDLVYLDPPFKSNQDYNVLFAEKDGSRAAAQFKAFEDTWEWNRLAAAEYEAVVEAGGRVSDVMQAFRRFLGTNDMLAYLTMMAPRLVELRRVLKTTGSIYLHCDPTASHYLKLLLDSVFGPINFRNEIIWRRTRAHNDAKLTRYGAVHDVLLFYSKTEKRIFNRIHTERDANRPHTHDLYRHTDGLLYRKDNCRAPGNRGPRYQWNGHEQHWRFTEAEARRLEKEGRIVYSKSGMPRVLRPVDLTKGSALQDVWTDIDPPNSGSGEILGYPTQKPEALLDRILESSSNEGDVVLDPFCGCGTAVAVAQRLKRNWIGIDITHLAIGLIKSRLRDAFGDAISTTYRVVGEPVSLPDAEALAKEDPYQFQWWALGLVGARRSEQKKGSDQGIDGRLYFHDDESGKTKQIILSVKSGHVSVPYVRDLRGVIDREKAEIGVLITLEEPTRAMLTEAASADFYKSPWGNHQRLQILTISDLLEGKKIDYPPTVNVTHKRAPRAEAIPAEQLTLTPGDDTPRRARTRRR